MENQKLKLSSPFIGRTDGVKFEGQVFKSKDIIEYKEVAEVMKTGEGKHDFKVIKTLVPVSKTNRADYIDSFASDVGIMNVLKKVLVGGETIEDIIKTGRFVSKQQGEVDLSKLPDNIVDAYKAVEAGVKAFDSLPDNLKKKQSFARFAESFSQDDFTNYLRAEVEKVLALQRKESKGD